MLSLADFDEVNDRFDKYDTNSDGHINLQEFVQGMSELMDDPAAREAIAKAGSKETTDEEEPEEMYVPWRRLRECLAGF
eukprot:scaffold301_cov243-Pinguiococcus_pyrenoidosus.AAC.67